MPKPVYPQAADLIQFLEAAGLVDSPLAGTQSLIDYEGATAAAITNWERSTGWEPFLFDPNGSATARRFDPRDVLRVPGDLPILELEAGAIEITAVRYGVSDVTPAGTLMVEDRDYFPAPANARAKGKPFTYLEFRTFPYGGVPWGTHRSLVIEAKWGYSDSVPDDVFRAILMDAAMLVMPEILAFTTGGVESWSEVDVTEKYGSTPHKQTIEMMTRQVERVRGLYRRLSL